MVSYTSRLGFALIALIGALISLDLYLEHGRTETREQERLELLAKALNANIGEQLRSTARTLDALREDIPELLETQEGVRRLNRRLEISAEAVTGVRTLLVVGADGGVIASNKVKLIGTRMEEGERYDTIRKSNLPETLYVSRPFETPLGLYTIGLGKTLSHDQATFRGYLMAIVDPDFFGVLMRSMLYAPDMRLSVAHGDGPIIFSTQDLPDIRGIDLSLRVDSAFVRHVKSGAVSSFAIDVATATGDKRFFAIHTVRPTAVQTDKPLVIGVSRDADGVFSEWRRYAIEVVGLYITSVIVTILAGSLLRRRRHALRRLHAEKEALRRGAEEQLEEKNAQFKAYFNNLATGAVQLDGDGVFQLVNDVYCKMTGYSREELVGLKRPSDITHPDDAADERARMEAVWAGETDVMNIEKRIIAKGGGIIWVHVSGQAVRDDHNKIKFYSFMIEDISLRHGLMRDLEDARVRAEAANKAKTLFLGNMSHEMRTPLHQMAGALSLLRKSPLAEKQAKWTGMIDVGVKRLDTVIGGILTLVDLESRSTSVRLKKLDIHQLVENVVAGAHERVESKGLQVRHQIGPLPEPLMGDPAHITTILACLCNNAITFSEKGTIWIRATCTREEAGSALVRFAVQDEGIGVAKEDIDRLFEHFEQADNSNTRRYGGTGVGLAIVRQLARMMGGEAGCDSVQGEGSTFWATVLLVKGAESVATAATDNYQI